MKNKKYLGYILSKRTRYNVYKKVHGTLLTQQFDKFQYYKWKKLILFLCKIRNI